MRPSDTQQENAHAAEAQQAYKKSQPHTDDIVVVPLFPIFCFLKKCLFNTNALNFKKVAVARRIDEYFASSGPNNMERGA